MNEEIVARWSAFRRHTDVCDGCENVRRAVVHNGGTPALKELWPAACAEGRPDLEAWHAIVREAVEEFRERARGGQMGLGMAG
jgi:hypothetical protein